MGVSSSTMKIKNHEYNIIKELGQGGFGRVVKVRRKSDNKEFALKIIPIKDELKERTKSFQNEIDILSKFNCDNILFLMIFC